MKKGFIYLMIAITSASIFVGANAFAKHKKHRLRHHDKASLSQVININRADAKSLVTLKGVGMKKAQAIIHYREDNGRFKSMDDLRKVKGISRKFIERLERNNPHRMVLK